MFEYVKVRELRIDFMQANYVSRDLMYKLEQGRLTEGYISSVFSTLFTVITQENELIYFLNNKKYMAPMSVVLEDLGSFQDLNLTPDTRVIFEDEKIIIDSYDIEIDLEITELWNPDIELLSNQTSEDLIENNLMIVEEGVYKHGKYEGFAPLIFNIGQYIEELKPLSNFNIHNNLYSSFISEKVIEFVFEIVNDDMDNIGKTTAEFLGFGPGITPSSDDFLCGFMISLIYCGTYYKLDLEKIYKFNEILLSEMELDREEMSHDLLVHYSKGKCQNMVKNLINSILFETDKEELCQSIRETISFGDISGTDIVCGIYFGARLIKNKNIKKLFI